MKVLTVQHRLSESDPGWIDSETLFTFFRSREGRLARSAEREAGHVKYRYSLYPYVRVRVVERTKHRARAVLAVCAMWALGGVAVAFPLALVFVIGTVAWRGVKSLNQESHHFDNLRSSVLGSTPGGYSRAAEAAYDVTLDCLGSQGVFESDASLYARCQSLSLEFVNNGSFPDPEKVAARSVITDLITRTIRCDAECFREAPLKKTRTDHRAVAKTVLHSSRSWTAAKI